MPVQSIIFKDEFWPRGEQIDFLEMNDYDISFVSPESEDGYTKWILIEVEPNVPNLAEYPIGYGVIMVIFSSEGK